MNKAFSVALIFTLCSKGAYASDDTRQLFLWSAGTQERELITYFADGHYISSAQERIARFLADPNSGDTRMIAPETLDFIYEIKDNVKRRTEKQEPEIHIISGYRSPEENAKLRNDKKNPYRQYVAKYSQHSLGTAIDFFIPGIKAEELRDIAWCLQKGGVGYYPSLVQQSGYEYIHIDTARVRFWGSSFNFNKIKCKDIMLVP